MVTGVSPHDDERLSLASEFGADLAVDVTTRDPVKALREVTGRGADVVVDVTAKAPAALAQAVKLARPGGRIVLAGTRGTTDTPGFSPDEVVFKELKIYGALGVDLEDFQDAFALLESGRYPTDVPRWAASLGEAEDLVRTMAGESGRRPPLHGVVTPALM
jgi:alcohol dehydrogenase